MKHCTQFSRSGISFFCWRRSKALTGMIFPSGAAKERGGGFPHCGGKLCKVNIFQTIMCDLQCFGGSYPSETCGLVTVGDDYCAPHPLEKLATSWVMDGSEEEEPGGSCTKGGGRLGCLYHNRCVPGDSSSTVIVTVRHTNALLKAGRTWCCFLTLMPSY